MTDWPTIRTRFLRTYASAVTEDQLWPIYAYNKGPQNLSKTTRAASQWPYENTKQLHAHGRPSPTPTSLQICLVVLSPLKPGTPIAPTTARGPSWITSEKELMLIIETAWQETCLSQAFDQTFVRK